MAEERPRTPPVRRERRVVLTALDQQSSTLSIDDLLRLRGFDPALPYVRVESPGELGLTYVQEIPPQEGEPGDAGRARA